MDFVVLRHDCSYSKLWYEGSYHVVTPAALVYSIKWGYQNSVPGLTITMLAAYSASLKYARISELRPIVS